MSQPSTNILCYNRKGGAGKSTLALHLGAAWLQLKPKDTVRFVDLDTQNSLVDTQEAFKRLKRAEFYPAEFSDCKSIFPLPGLNIFDSPNLLSEDDFENFIVSVDMLVIPMTADFESLKAAKRTLEAMQEIKPALPVKVAITAYSTAKDSRGKRPGPEVKAEAQQLFGVLLCRSIISRSANITSAASAGESVFKYAADSSVAKAYRKLTNEILKDYL